MIGGLGFFFWNTLGTLLPYDEQLDAHGIYFSQFILLLQKAVLFASHTVGLNRGVKIDNSKNNHQPEKNQTLNPLSISLETPLNEIRP